jgi:hypothetical protein
MITVRLVLAEGSLAIEAITVVALLVWIVLMATTPPPPTRHPGPVAQQGRPRP